MEHEIPPVPEFERAHLRDMSTPDLVRHVLAESKLFLRAEVLHAKAELQDEIRAAKVSGILVGAAAVLGLVGIALLFVALALSLALPEPIAALVVAAGLLVCAAVAGLLAWQRLKHRPLPHTQERLRHDARVARETLQ